MLRHSMIPLLLSIWAAAPRAMAQSPDPPDGRSLGWVAVEFDPVTTPLGARNLLIVVEPPSVPHVSLSAVIFASDFPAWVDDLMSYRNRGEGFDQRVRLSPGVTADWYFADERMGWHAGTFVFYWRYEASRNDDVAHFENLILLPRVGYRWFPFAKIPVYVDPFAGVMFEVRAGGDNTVDGGTVRPSPIVPFATMHLGIHF